METNKRASNLRKENKTLVFKSIKVKSIEFVKKLGTIDYGNVTFFYGKYSSLECLILEIQNIEHYNEDHNSVNNIIQNYMNTLYEDNHILDRIGIVYDEIKGSLFILYEYSKNGFIFINEYIVDKTYEEKLQIFIDLISEITYLKSEYRTSNLWLFPWNILVPISNANNKKKSRFLSKCIIIEPFFGNTYEKLLKDSKMSIRTDIKCRAPEFFNKNFTEEKVDEWAFSLCIYELLFGEKLFTSLKIKDDIQVKKLFMSKEFKLDLSNLTNDKNIRKFFNNNALIIDPTNRASFLELSKILERILDCYRNTKQVKENYSKINENISLVNCKLKKEMNVANKISQVDNQKEQIKKFKIECEKNIRENSQLIIDLVRELEKNQLELMNKLSKKFDKKMNNYKNETSRTYTLISKRISELQNEALSLNDSIVLLGDPDEKGIKKQVINEIDAIGENLLRKSESLVDDTNEFEHNTVSSFFDWDQKFICKMDYIKNVTSNFNTAILENITFVKYNSLLKCSKNEEYVTDDELILKYLDDNFFFIKKHMGHFTNFLEELSQSVNATDFESLKEYLIENMDKSKNEIFDKINEELDSNFQKIVEFCVTEIYDLINREKIEISQQRQKFFLNDKNFTVNETSLSTGSNYVNMINNVEKEVERKIIETIRKYLIYNKDPLLCKLSLFLTQDILINCFSEIFERHFNNEFEKSMGNISQSKSIQMNDYSPLDIKLDLNYSNLGVEGFKVIVDLMYLSLNKDMDDRNIQFIRKPLISILNLRSNNLCDEGIELLANLMKKRLNSLKSLSLYGNNISHLGMKLMIEAFHTNRSLYKLSLNNNQIGTDGLLYLCEGLSINNNIITLDIGSNNINDEGIKILSTNLLLKNSTLVTLSLNTNIISDDGVIYLANVFETHNNFKLKNLSLSSNMITNRGLEKLLPSIKNRPNNNIETIDLNSNSIGDLGAIVCSEFIKGNQNIVQLFLNNNEITNEGAEILTEAVSELLEDLQIDCVLERLSLLDNHIVIDKLKSSFKTNTKLSSIIIIQLEDEEYEEKSSFLDQSLRPKKNSNIHIPTGFKKLSLYNPNMMKNPTNISHNFNTNIIKVPDSEDNIIITPSSSMMHSPNFKNRGNNLNHAY